MKTVSPALAVKVKVSVSAGVAGSTTPLTYCEAGRTCGVPLLFGSVSGVGVPLRTAK